MKPRPKKEKTIKRWFSITTDNYEYLKERFPDLKNSNHGSLKNAINTVIAEAAARDKAEQTVLHDFRGWLASRELHLVGFDKSLLRVLTEYLEFKQ